MKKVIVIDIGNTNITAGVFAGDALCVKAKSPTHSPSRYAMFFRRLITAAGMKPGDIGSIMISSVVPVALSRLVVQLNRMSATSRRIYIIGKDIATPIKNEYRNKSEVGQDRLVNAFAAARLYGTPAIVVDFGTAITFDIVSPESAYLGGLIMPGIELSLSSLYTKTALLPRVDLKAASSIIGRDTVSSMRGGILFGFGAMCDGLVAQYRHILGKRAKVIATGGNAELVKKYAKSIQIVDEDLTLKGLALLAPKS